MCGGVRWGHGLVITVIAVALAWAAGCDWTGKKEHEARELYDRALELELEKDYDGALVALQDITTRFPRTGVARKVEEARDRIQEALRQRDEEQAGELYNKALSLVEENQFEWALRLLDDVESHYPETAVAAGVAHAREVLIEEKRLFEEEQRELSAEERRGRIRAIRARLAGGGEAEGEPPVTLDQPAARKCCCSVKDLPPDDDGSGTAVITHVRVPRERCESGDSEIVDTGRLGEARTVRRTYLGCVSDGMCRW